MKHFYSYFLLFLKGLGIGSVDIVPGISGSTIALFVGVYEELLQAFQAFDVVALQLLSTGQFKALWKYLRGSFLLPLVLGIGLSMVTTVQFVIYFLTDYPIQTWSFFSGITLVTVSTIYQKIKRWHLRTVLISLGGLIVAYGITRATPLHTPHSSFFIGLSGCIAVCAMLLPGISGSFMLVLLGKYMFMLHALQTFQLSNLIPFALGGVIGLLSFSRLVAWLLRRYHDSTLALLAGFIIGSLSKTWPWKQLQENLAHESLLSPQNLSPAQFQATYHQDPLVLQALLWTCIGISLVVGLERIAREKKLRSKL